MIGRLHVITDTTLQSRFTHAELAERAIAGGADVVQLRHKGGSTRELVAAAVEVQAVCRRHGVPLIVNDRLDVALAVGAAGVHLGQEDLPADLARPLLPAGGLLGASARTEERILAAVAAGADYIGYGPVFPTSSKPDAETAKGVEGLRRMRRATDCPIVAIGGITVARVAGLIAAGAHGVAVISAVCCRPDPEAATRQLKEEILRALGQGQAG